MISIPSFRAAVLGATRSVFSPDSLPSLVAWYRADAGVLNGAGSPAAPADPVKAWQDQSGQGHDLVQATTAKMPTYSSTTQKGLRYLVFDGTDDLMSAGFAPFGAGGGDGTLFAVFTDSDPFGLSRIAVQGSVAGGVDWGLVETTARKVGLQVAAGIVNAADTLATGNWYCGVGVVDTGGAVQVTVRRNGAQVGSGALPLPWSGGDNMFVVGANPAASVFLNGNLAEVLAYNRALAIGEIMAVETYLSSRWGLGF